MPSRDPHDVVRLTMADNLEQAHILEQALHDEGIQARVVGDYLDAGLGNISTLRPEVWVHRDDLAAAQRILTRQQPKSDTSEE